MSEILIGNKKYERLYQQKTFYVARPSALGNPFAVKRSKFSEDVFTPDVALKLYKDWLWSKIVAKDVSVLKALNEINKLSAIGVVLLCWCVNENGVGDCHARIIKDCVLWMKANR